MLILTLFLFQAHSVLLLLFGVISTSILPGDKQNQIDGREAGGAPEAPEVPPLDWRQAVPEVSTGLKCVFLTGRSGSGIRGRETLLGCTKTNINICQSPNSYSSTSSASYLREFRARRVEVCEEKKKCGLVMRGEARKETVRHCTRAPPVKVCGDLGCSVRPGEQVCRDEVS